MNFEEYLPTVLKRAKPLPHRDQMDHALIGMVTELGELATDVKNAFIYGKPFDVINAQVEIGDYAWYFALWCIESEVEPRFLDYCAKFEMTREGAAESSLVELVLQLAATTGSLVVSAEERGDQLTNEMAAEIIITFLLAVSLQCDTTLQECLTKNDAKLELRHGDKYQANASADRDVAAERAIAES